MKKHAKLRLTLSRETLRALDAEEMAAAPGGVSSPFCLITDSCYNCPTQTCPTRCGQTYCYYV
jgi:hypothetical protein